MLSRNLGLALAATGAANAVLIPPSVSAAELDLGDGMAMEIAAGSFPRTATLDCATCELAVKEGDGLVWTQRDGNSFMLNFEVGPQEDSLKIDGIQLYPPVFEYFTQPFRVAQVNPDGEDLPLRVTGYTFRYDSAETVSEAGVELIPMTFQINAIEGKPVDPPALTINLLKDTNGRLMIASFQTGQADEPSPADADKECNEWPLLCKWRGIVADRINSLKSSMGKAGCHKHKTNPMIEEAIQGKPPHRFRPGHPHHVPHRMGGHDGHRHHRHHRHHRVHMMLRRAFFTIIIPIFIGIFAGTLTYLVGMALGCFIAVTIAKFRGRSSYDSVAQDEESDIAEDRDEKETYSDLPEYDAPPVYEEVAEKEVAENKQ